jgi:hypothetical protein
MAFNGQRASSFSPSPACRRLPAIAAAIVEPIVSPARMPQRQWERICGANHATLEIDMLPFGMEDFAQSCAGQQQQSNRRKCMAIDLAPPILGLRSVLRLRSRLVNRVG